MGYEVHITRKANWLDDEGPAISLEEWKSYIASDPDMRLDGYAEAPVGNGHVLRVEDEGLAVWTAHPNNGVNHNMAWFHPSSGGIAAKNPDAAILRKMYEIAQALGARVVGDEEEEYGPDGEIIAPNDASTEDAATESEAPARRWWKFF